MEPSEALQKAINLVGTTVLEKAIGMRYNNIYVWIKKNRLPDSEYSCRTSYAKAIQKATKGKVKVKDLLGHIPTCVRKMSKK